MPDNAEERLKKKIDDATIETFTSSKYRLIGIVKTILVVALYGSDFHTFFKNLRHDHLLHRSAAIPDAHATGSVYFSRTQS